MNKLYAEPSPLLLKKVLERVHKEERFLVLKRIIAFSAMLVISLVGFVPSLSILLSDFSKSGFISFFSLIFSCLLYTSPSPRD